MAGFDVGMLLGTQGVQVPDPVQQFVKVQSLGDLARRGRMGALEEEETRRKLDASKAYEAALPDLIDKQFSAEAVAQAARANPAAAAMMLKEADARRKARLDEAKTGAEIGKHRADTRAKDLAIVSGLAQATLDDPESGPRQVQTIARQMADMGHDPRSFGDWQQDPRGWLKNAAAASIDAAKAIELKGQAETRAETGRHNLATEANTVRGQDLTAQTTREGHRVTARGQDLTDARARDFNAIARSGNVGKGTTDLRKEFNDLPEVKSFKTVIPVLKSVQSAPDTTAGDLDVIYGVGKILDPTSVVREGEMSLVIKSGSPLERALGAMGYVVGRGRLTPAMRAKLVGMLEGRVGEIESQYNAARQTYERAADANQLPKDQIFTELPPVTRSGAKAPATGGLQRAPDGTLTYGF